MCYYLQMVDIKSENDLESIRIRVLQTAEDYLYHGKTPKYPTFFSKWATRTIEGEYLKDLVEAEMSSVGKSMLLGQVNGGNTAHFWYWRGYAAGILRMSVVINSKAKRKIEVGSIDEVDENDVIGN